MNMRTYVIKQIKKIISERNVNISESFDDSMVFKVYGGDSLKSFLSELKKYKNLKIINKTKSGGYFNIKVMNSGSGEDFMKFAKFYTDNIKI